MALEYELGVFRANLDTLLGPGDVNEGRWTVIHGDTIAGIFPTWDDDPIAPG